MIISRISSLVAVATTASFLLAGAVRAQDSAGGNDWKLDLDRANTLLAQGKYNDAISLYDDVIQKDKKNYLSYYKRALSYLGLSRFNAAITDLNSVLEIQPDFSAALLRRGKILAWQGDFSNAVKDLRKVPHQDDLINDITEAGFHFQEAQAAEKKGDYQKCIESAGSALGVGPGLASLWQLRSRCALAVGDTEGAVGDLTQASKLLSTAEVNLLLSNLLFYSLNDVESALNSVKMCLHQDPENKECKKEFRTLKNGSKSLSQLQEFINGEQWHQAIRILITQRFREQIETQITHLKENKILKPNAPNRLLAQLDEWACQTYSGLKKHNVGIRHCDLALDLNPDSVPSLIGKANYFLQEESYDQAIQLLNKANELTGGQNGNIRQQLERAQRLLRQSKKRDYYKILGVPRDSDAKAIRKAYRNLSKQYHPDKYRGDLDDEAVSRKMAEINSAYEVLSNEELRTRYDNGDDPNDHEGQQGYPGGNPFMFHQGGQNFFFQQKGNPFQGGQFKFNFR